MTQCQREQYVKELQKHIPVDIFGGCGKKNCSQSHGSVECKSEIEKTYKFYLSFENSWCNDYVTEKFWDALNSTMVPVVLGGTNYSSIAPPNSFIDASKYSPKELATILKKLDKNEEEILKYFHWKNQYSVFQGNAEHRRLCDLCEKLNSPMGKTKKSYTDLAGWWIGAGQCKVKGSFPWSKPDSLGTVLTNNIKNLLG